MARVDFNKEFLDLSENEELVIEFLLSVYELFTRENLVKRFSLRTHRFSKINRLAFYQKAIATLRTEGGFSPAFRKLADEAEKILARKFKTPE